METDIAVVILLVGVIIVLAILFRFLFRQLAIPAFIGFSVAIGVFFAGLIFSTDPESVKIDASFEAVHDFFVPFFFVSIGMAADPAAFAGIGWPLFLLLAAAVLGKLLGAGIPAALTLGFPAGVMIGISMITCAEIALIIMQRGLSLGNLAVTPELFTWVVAISATTALVMPLVLRRLLAEHTFKWEMT
ncbi:MAG: cation:proton antiporter [Balneolaceae bacterium]|nr:cation:proton antiporter [Balneolaceae bacterium]